MKEVFNVLGRKLIFSPEAVDKYFCLAKIRRGEDAKFRTDMNDIIDGRNEEKIHNALFDPENDYYQEVRILAKQQMRVLINKEKCPSEYYEYFCALRDVVEENPALTIPAKLCNAENILLDTFMSGSSEELLEAPIPVWIRETLQLMVIFPQFVACKHKVDECEQILFLLCSIR